MTEYRKIDEDYDHDIHNNVIITWNMSWLYQC